MIREMPVRPHRHEEIDDDGELIDIFDRVPVGGILVWPTTTAPSGFLVCDGSAISRTTYFELFDLIGTTFGSGDGSTTFNLPNLKGKFVAGYNSAEGEFDAMGETGGAKSVTSGECSAKNFQEGDGSAIVAGENHTHEVATLPPYITLNYIIKTGV